MVENIQKKRERRKKLTIEGREEARVAGAFERSSPAASPAPAPDPPRIALASAAVAIAIAAAPSVHQSGSRD
uniref:Uncharacterized protein n=1 Tax=Oryza nivara TaxID=4536 RepID=A0A0E0HWJ5_ORYNI